MKQKTILLIVLVLLCIVFFFVDPVRYNWVPQCPFKLITGWSCPGCGIQRAAHAVLHGDFLTAVHYNWFLVLSLPYALLLIIAQWCVGPKKRNEMMRYLGHRYTIYAYMICFFIWLVVRNVYGI